MLEKNLDIQCALLNQIPQRIAGRESINTERKLSGLNIGESQHMLIDLQRQHAVTVMSSFKNHPQRLC
jgi:hypothetical protein